MDYRGAVKAMIGGKDWNVSQFNRATMAKRQPGSVFKTFVYLSAMEIGFSEEDLIEDTPLILGDWKPRNSNNKYEGLISLKSAFAKSSNVAAVRLSEKIGRKFIIKQVKRLGITSYIPNEPSMPLGTASISLIELTGAFVAIAGNGTAVIPYGIRKIKTRDKKNIWVRNSPVRDPIIDKVPLKKIKKLLREVITHGTGIRASSLNMHILGKTGTSQNNRDAWFIGCTKNHVIGIWIGRDDDKSMKGISGSNIPVEIFNSISSYPNL